MLANLHNKRNAFRSFRTFGATSRYFNGVDDRIEITSTPRKQVPLTISAWVKLDNITSVGGIVSIEGNVTASTNTGFGLVQVNGEIWAFAQESSTFDKAVNTSALAPNVWYHVCGVFRSNTDRQIYINGIGEGSNSTNLTPDVNFVDNIVLGNRAQTVNDQPFAGNIADCRIYDDALTPRQVSDLYNGLDLRNNLVGQWLINADDTLDHSINSNNGKNIGQSSYSLDGPLPSNQLFGKYSRAFSGISEYIDCGNAVPLFPNLPYTVSTWVKVDPTFNDIGVICARGLNVANSSAYTRDLFLFTFDTGNGQSSFSAQRSKSSGPFEQINSTNTFPKGVWYHVCATYDGSNLEIFVDGMSEGTVVSTVAVTTTDKFYIAKSLGPVDYKINGNLADIRVYDSVLTASQISDLYNGADVQTGLIGHWLRNADDLLDHSSNNNHGTEGETGSLFDINDGPKYR